VLVNMNSLRSTLCCFLGSCRPKTGMSHRREYRDSRASTARSRFAARAVSAPAKTRSSPIS